MLVRLLKLPRRLPYILLSGIFVSGGLDAALRPQGKVPKAEHVTEPAMNELGVDVETAQLVRVNGIVQVVGGLMLAAGVLPRVAATALAGSLVPTTLAGHRFWAEVDPQARTTQRIQFLKNASMLGGLLVVALGPHAPTGKSRRA